MRSRTCARRIQEPTSGTLSSYCSWPIRRGYKPRERKRTVMPTNNYRPRRLKRTRTPTPSSDDEEEGVNPDHEEDGEDQEMPADPDEQKSVDFQNVVTPSTVGYKSGTLSLHYPCPMVRRGYKPRQRKGTIMPTNSFRPRRPKRTRTPTPSSDEEEEGVNPDHEEDGEDQEMPVDPDEQKSADFQNASVGYKPKSVNSAGNCLNDAAEEGKATLGVTTAPTTCHRSTGHHVVVIDSETDEDGEENQEMQSDQAGQDSTLHEKVTPSSVGIEPEPKDSATEMPFTSAAAKRFEKTPSMNGVKDVGMRDDVCNIGLMISGEDTMNSISRASVTSVSQSNRSDITCKFEGFNIQSSLIPTLQTIWSKHGNILENCMMRSGDMIAMALESLVTMVCIMEDNSVRALSDCQVSYLSDTLCDMRCMGFKLDWLVPYVEKAVELHKNKPQLDTLNILRQKKALAMERRSNLLEDLTKINELVKGLDEQMGNVSRTICFSGEVDLDNPVGAGM